MLSKSHGLDSVPGDGCKGIRLFFWAYTGRAWEDALITVLHSENAVSGLGLTHFKIDEPPIHGFTSPLSVLVPLIGDAIHVGLGLPLINFVSAVLGAGAIALVFLIDHNYRSLRLPLPLIIATAVYIGFEHHQILWGIAGMETQIVCFVLLLSIHLLYGSNPYALGSVVAACIYARPDFAIWAAIIGLTLIARRVPLAYLAKVVLTAVVLYLPWLLFTFAYYGSPVPNTILAKSYGYPFWASNVAGFVPLLQGAYEHLVREVLGPQSPTFAGHGTGFHLLYDDGILRSAMLTFLIGGFLVAIFKRQTDLMPLYAFVVLFSLYYIFLVPIVFGWYCVPLNALATLLAIKGVRDAIELIAPARAQMSLACVAAAAHAGMFLAALPTTIRAERLVQQQIENPVRRAIGEYLAANTPKEATIAGEPLGYIAYYSRRTYYDWPGLASRRVVDLLRNNPDRKGLISVADAIRPDYLVLRRSEYELYSGLADSSWLRDGYLVERRFSTPPEALRRILFFEANVDHDFVLLRRRDRSIDLATGRGTYRLTDYHHLSVHQTGSAPWPHLKVNITSQGRAFDSIFATPGIAIEYKNLRFGSNSRFQSHVTIHEQAVAVSDGVEFIIGFKTDKDSIEIARKRISAEDVRTGGGWIDFEAALSSVAGRFGSLLLSTGPGPAGNAIGDWAIWGEPVVLSAGP